MVVQRRQMDTIPRSESCDSSGNCGYFGILVMEDLKMDLVSMKWALKAGMYPALQAHCRTRWWCRGEMGCQGLTHSSGTRDLPCSVSVHQQQQTVPSSARSSSDHLSFL